jgi:hypothetical protein
MWFDTYAAELWFPIHYTRSGPSILKKVWIWLCYDQNHDAVLCRKIYMRSALIFLKAVKKLLCFPVFLMRNLDPYPDPLFGRRILIGSGNLNE